jgi:hypoxanthine phosphoribosyltransferase
MVHRSVLKVAEELQKQNFQPDLIIGVGRGGIIAAGLLCSELTGEKLVESSKKGVREIQSPKIRLGTLNSTVFLKDTLRQIGAEKGEFYSRIDRIVLSEVDMDIAEDEKVLLIVAQNFTGSTLGKAKNVLLTQRVSRSNIKTAALFWHKHENITLEHEPDFFGSAIPIDKTMPWKYHEINTDRY